MLKRFSLHSLICAAVLAVVLCGLAGSGQAAARDSVTIVAAPDAGGKNHYYVGNRAPLLPSPLIKLPIGSIQPQGWVRHQLKLQAEGFSGRLTEISPWCEIDGNAWVSKDGKGHSPWEEMPYWLKGQIDLGYVLKDKRIIDESNRWVEGIISSRQPDGYFGPQENKVRVDQWPNMVALCILRSHYEATGDKRVLSLMTDYCKWLSSIPLYQYLPESWQKVRGGDNLDIIYWLYNHTGDKWLLDLARVNHERTVDWVGGVASWHGVNFAQCFREPAQYYQQTHDKRYLDATQRDFDFYYGTFGQVPGGMYGADENARTGYTGPRQAVETCAMVEVMYSDQMLTAITGDIKWADHCEDVTFNSLPASMTPDLKGLHYLTSPNMVQLDRKSKAPMIQNGGDMLSYNPYDFRCCQHNVAQGWPYYTESLWMATQGNGLAAVLYAPSEVSARVGDGTTVKIKESTGYPFDETVELAISLPKPARFPLYLRIPGWCSKPDVSVNGVSQGLSDQAKGWILVSRTWENGDKVRLEFPMPLRVKVWEKNKNSVSVYRGPLAYSLKIGEKWEKWGGTDRWPAFEVYPTTPWNYGLVFDPKAPEASFEAVRRKKQIPDQPFTVEDAPIVIKAKGKRIPKWQMESNGLIQEVQGSPVKSSEPVEEITLVPMGCARLRVSAFPQIGDGPEAKEWDEVTVGASASYVNPTDSVTSLGDDMVPAKSSDNTTPRFTWWDHMGTTEWVQYSFSKAKQISSCEVYWFDDGPIGGGCSVPASWKVLWWDGNAWQPVTEASAYTMDKDKMNKVTFKAVQTSRLRLDVQLQPGRSGGILEWRFAE